MYLQHLELLGFKSFARKTVLEFMPRVTAIVGPNGCGKSCLVDGIRWVLGEQSMKLLRSKKSEDVIFSGSSKLPRVGMAEVSLSLDNSDHRMPIDFNEVVITRKLFRDGESEYQVNKRKVRLSDIILLLARSNFGQRTYSIIGQGMIDAFLLASPNERKEFIEEGAGVKKYQIKKNEAQNKLNLSRENLLKVEIQLKEIEPRLRSLTRQVKKLERRKEIELKLRDLEQKYYGSLWQEVKLKIKSEKSKLEETDLLREKTEKEVNKIQEEIAKLTKGSSRLDKFESLQKGYQKLSDEKAKLKEEEITIKTQELLRKEKKKSAPLRIVQETIEELNQILNYQKNLSREISRIKNLEELRKISEKVEEIARRIERTLSKLKPFIKEETQGSKLPKNQGEIKSLEEKMRDLRNKISENTKEDQEERKRIWYLQQEFQKRQAELNKLIGRVNEIKVALARLETKRDDLIEEIKGELGEPEELKGGKELSELEKREMISEIGRLKHQLELVGGIDPEITKEYPLLKNRYDFLKNQSDDLRKAIKSLGKLIKDLDETIKDRFNSAFNKINEEFQKYFKILFGGGKAKLILIKEEPLIPSEPEGVENGNVISLNSKGAETLQGSLRNKKTSEITGIDIQATPPGKKLKSINMLSGGEKALSSIALICALISFNPSPFVVLDEVDAALDEANSLRFAKIIESLSLKTQFIIITHNRATMEKADILYGVTMGEEGASRLLSLKLEAAEKYTNR